MSDLSISVIMPAYNAAATLEKTYREIPHDIVDDVIVVAASQRVVALTADPDVIEPIDGTIRGRRPEQLSFGARIRMRR